MQEIERPELSNLAAENKVTKTNSEENDSAQKTWNQNETRLVDQDREGLQFLGSKG